MQESKQLTTKCGNGRFLLKKFNWGQVSLPLGFNPFSIELFKKFYKIYLF